MGDYAPVLDAIPAEEHPVCYNHLHGGPQLMVDYRPRYHLTPARYWMNDPNGLVHHNGVWHAFFQHNSGADTFGEMSWGHASSPDLVRWTEHAVALRHSVEEQIYSGCVVVDRANTSGFGSFERPPLVAVYTSMYARGIQAQSLAVSLDGGETWTPYDDNPVLDRGSAEFRDPKVFWYPTGPETGHWVMVAVEAVARQVLVFSSDDLRTWTPLSEFGPAGPPAGHWECPDLFPLEVDGDPARVRWVLVVSLNPGGVAGGSGTCCFVGHFDGTTFTPERDEVQWLDWGPDFYAAVTFDSAPHGRRIALAWMSNWDYAREVPTTPWRGALSLPRELSLRDVDGRAMLVQRPVRELEVLDDPAAQVTGAAFDLAGEHDLAGAAAYRLDVTFEVGDADEVGLELFVGPHEATRLTWTEAGGLALDRRQSGETGFSPAFASLSRAPLALADGRLRLEVYVDRASVEVFAQGGAACLTQQVFAPAESTGVRLVSRGGTTRVAALVLQPLVSPA